MNSPVEKVIDGRAGLLKEADLTKLTTKQGAEDAVRAEEMMDDARGMCDESKIEHRMGLQICCQHDMRLVLFIMKKGKASKEAEEYTSLEQAGQVFVDALGFAVGEQYENPWLKAVRMRGKHPPQGIAGLS